MPQKRRRPERIAGKLRDADAVLSTGKTIGQACQSLEISERTEGFRTPPMRPKTVDAEGLL